RCRTGAQVPRPLHSGQCERVALACQPVIPARAGMTETESRTCPGSPPGPLPGPELFRRRAPGGLDRQQSPAAQRVSIVIGLVGCPAIVERLDLAILARDREPLGIAPIRR